MTQTNRTEARLTIVLSDLLPAFRLLLKTRKRKLKVCDEAVLSYDGACLHFALSGITVAVPAVGTWPGQARLPGRVILGLAEVPPTHDPVVLAVEQDRLTFGTTSVPCVWQSAWLSQIDMPANAAILHYLALRQTHTNEEIMQSGLSAAVKDAEVKRDRIIGAALKSLSRLDITETDLRRLLDTKIGELPRW